jgi:recombination protein RecA
MSSPKKAETTTVVKPVVEQSAKQKALDLALSAIEKQFGKGSVMKMGNDYRVEEIPLLSSGIPSLDLAISGSYPGGIPKGRIIEIYGPESSGKTTTTLHFAAECQRNGGTVAFIDAEHALDVNYAAKLGVDIPNTIISQPDSGEQALEIADTLIKSGAVDLLIVDSVAALTPIKEIEGEMGDSHMGLQARLMSQGLRKLTGSISRSGTTVIFINQLRMKIGVMFGNPETTTGGNALKFYASVRLDIRKTGHIKDGDEIIGSQTKVKVIKNKVFTPFKECEPRIMYGKAGFDVVADLLQIAVNKGIVEKAGAWYSFQNQKLGQGENNSVKALEADPIKLQEIKDALSVFFSPKTRGEIPL